MSARAAAKTSNDGAPSPADKADRDEVTIVVPCYNYARYLKGCVQSILSATTARVSIIVIDDCSTDETPTVCAELTRAHACVRAFRHERNWGHIATYNHGLSLVNAEFVHLISADDQLMPGALDRAIAIMRQHDDVGIVYGGVVTGPEAPMASRQRGRPRYAIVRGHDWIAARCADGRNPIYSPEVTLRAAVAKVAGPYEPSLPRTADLEMWMRAAARSNVAVIEGVPQAFYRRHHNNMHSAHAKEGLLVGLQERANAYNIFFGTHGHLVPDAQRLHRIALDRVARDALRRTNAAFDESEGNSNLLALGEQMARSLTERAEHFWEWRRHQARLMEQRRPAPAKVAVRKLLSRFERWWHWHRIGNDLGHRGLAAIARGRL
jgi:GT2 family glycosyltransferase